MADYITTLFTTSYMYVGLLVGIVLTTILFMWVIKPGLSRCEKDYPKNCTDKAVLIPVAGTCGAPDFCEGGSTCVNGKCVKD